MKTIQLEVPLRDEDPIEIRAVKVLSAFPNDTHRVEVRHHHAFFWQRIATLPATSTYRNIFGREQERPITYTSTWTYLEYDLQGKEWYSEDYLTVESPREFEDLKKTLLTYGDYRKLCEEEQQQILDILEEREREEGDWY